MRLRTNQVFTRFSWTGNVLAEQGHRVLLREAEAVTGVSFTEIQNVARRTEFRPLSEARLSEWLPEVPSDEAHPTLNVALRAPFGGGEEVSLTLFAGPHPYTGRYVVQYGLLVPRALIAAQSSLSPWIEQFRDYAGRWDALSGHMHDADDNSIQNTASAGMLKLGFGVDVDEVNLAENPGREVSRGEFRFAINWLTYFGPQMVERLQRFMDADAELPPEVEAVADGWFIQLSETPLNPDDPSVRERQRRLKDQLALKPATDENARAFGFWQRKG